MNVIIYGVAKFLGYSALSYFGYQVIHQKPSSAQIFSAGAKRWPVPGQVNGGSVLSGLLFS
jgi:hypothetical protein